MNRPTQKHSEPWRTFKGDPVKLTTISGHYFERFECGCSIDKKPGEDAVVAFCGEHVESLLSE